MDVFSLRQAIDVPSTEGFEVDTAIKLASADAGVRFLWQIQQETLQKHSQSTLRPDSDLSRFHMVGDPEALNQGYTPAKKYYENNSKNIILHN